MANENQVTEGEKASEDTKRKPYKGETVKVGSLVGQNSVACEAIVREVPVMNAQWGRVGGGKLPSLFVITNCQDSPYGKGTKTINYVDYLRDFRQNAMNVSDDLEVRVLTGTQGKKMAEAWTEHKLKNLSMHLWHGFHIGSDPEIFVENKDGNVLPAFRFLGSKKETKVISRDGAKVYWDGFQAEFETKANTCLAYLVDSVQYGLAATLQAARKVDKDAKLSTRTVMEIPFDMLQSTEEEFVALGCMPSRNAYGLKGKEVPPRELPFRPAGGHMHFGLGPKPEPVMIEIVKALDAILAVACVPLFQNFDNPIRREFYGLPGEYRLPPHGLEYRTLSNAWLIHPVLMHMVYELGRKAVMFGMNGFRFAWKGSEEETIEVVKGCDVAGARKIMDRNKDMYLKLIAAAHLSYPDPKTGKSDYETAFNIFYNGLETAIAKPEDIAGNWCIDTGWTAHSDGPRKNWRTCAPFFVKGEKV